MKKTLLMIQLILMSSIAHAQDMTTEPKSSFPPVQWSTTSTEPVKIENGTGANLVIHITVSGNSESPGIMLQNCGQTTSIKAGSTAICTTNDAKNPVTFSSDSVTAPATGTYLISEKTQ